MKWWSLTASWLLSGVTAFLPGQVKVESHGGSDGGSLEHVFLVSGFSAARAGAVVAL